MLDLIFNTAEINKFYSKIYEPLKLNEVHFISLAARNKYLTDEERSEIQLGGTQMIFKTVLRSYDMDKFRLKICQISDSAKYYRSLNDKAIPIYCFVFYANINPSDTLKATKSFKQILDEYDEEVVRVSMSDKRDNSKFENIMRRYNNLYNTLLSCYQKYPSRKLWVDLDIDLLFPEHLKFIREGKIKTSICKKYNVSEEDVYQIDTRGGVHVLLRTSSMSKEFNPLEVKSFLKASLDFSETPYKEVEINGNAMVPIPGTLQGGAEVKMY